MSAGLGRSRLRFSTREVRDFLLAWIALAVAFTILLERPAIEALTRGRPVDVGLLGVVFGMSLLTVGVGFLLHELGHKVVAVHFDQVAEFRADYGMLGIALVFSLLGVLFAAPGAVYHRGRVSPRERGLIALAGPLVNLVLAIGFLGLATVSAGLAAAIGTLGFQINLFLAGFNMLPWGPLDGRTVLDWSRPVFAASFAATAGPAAAVLLGAFP